MSATTVAPLGQIDVAGTPRTPFGRLVKVELRKMVDTRGGFWLLAITALLIVLLMAGILAVAAFTDSDLDLTASTLSQIFTLPVSLLVPVFGVLIVTSEWSQRTAMVTFALEPHRIRVILAKLAAVTALALATIVLAVAIGALTNVLLAAVDGTPTVWDLKVTTLFWVALVQVAYFGMGFALGALLRSTAGAVAVYYVIALLLPAMVWPALYFIFGWAQDILPWVDINMAATPIIAGTDFSGQKVTVGAIDYVRVAFTITLWAITPLALGIWRLLRAEVK